MENQANVLIVDDELGPRESLKTILYRIDTLLISFSTSHSYTLFAHNCLHGYYPDEY